MLLSSLALWVSVATAGEPDHGPISVVGGEPVESGDWPDAAALMFHDVFACSAVLIAPDVVLTAGHCFGSPYSLKKQVVLDTNDYEVGGISINIAEQYVYPDPLRTFDIAVFVLEESAPVAHRPLLLDCLADDWLQEGLDVSVVGFGATDPDGVSRNQILHEARTTVRVPACPDGKYGCNPQVSPDGELVAGGDGVDSCVGDSGGPLYAHTPKGIYLVGITSRAALPAETACGGGGIYVRADAIADWVESVTGRTLDRPSCDGVNRPPKPTALPIAIAQGGLATTRIEPGDPNGQDQHDFLVIRHPLVGRASVSETGWVTYEAPTTLQGTFEIVVQVRDPGGLTGEVTIPTTIYGPDVPSADPTPAGGCSGESTAAWAALLLLPLGLRRRSPPS